MFEKMTFEYIMENMLKNVPEGIDKRQGSIIYDAVAPVCAELAKLYIDMDMVINNCFADTAARAYLIKRGAEHGVVPYSATKGVFKGEFNISVDIGTRFNLDQYNYRVVEQIDNFRYKLECETEGSGPNGVLGTMTPLEYISGLTKCQLTQMLIPGEDEEETEAFRERYFKLLNKSAFGGNVEDYKEKVKAIEGVGQVRVLRCEDWQGAGTVGIIITDSDNKVPTDVLVNSVQNILDPESGQGIGIAPIGHIVSVNPVEILEADIKASVLLADGVSTDSITTKINAVVEEYIAERNKLWENTGVYLYTSQLSARLLEIEGIINISSLSINSDTTYVYTQDKIVEISNLEVSVAYAE